MQSGTFGCQNEIGMKMVVEIGTHKCRRNEYEKNENRMNIEHKQVSLEPLSQSAVLVECILVSLYDGILTYGVY